MPTHGKNNVSTLVSNRFIDGIGSSSASFCRKCKLKTLLSFNLPCVQKANTQGQQHANTPVKIAKENDSILIPFM